MTEEDLHYIEAELNVALPSDYRAVLRDFPFPTDGGSWVYWLYDNPDDIVNETRFPQEDGGYDKHNWKQTYVVIGQGAAGDTHLLDTALNPSPVYLLSHEDHSIVEEWPSLQAFVSAFREEQVKIDAARIARERHAQEQRQRDRQMLCVLFLGLLVAFLLIWLLIISKRKGLEKAFADNRIMHPARGIRRV